MNKGEKMKTVKIQETFNGVRNVLSLAATNDKPGRKDGKEIYEIKDVPDEMHISDVYSAIRQTTIASNRHIFSFRELKNSRFKVIKN